MKQLQLTGRLIDAAEMLCITTGVRPGTSIQRPSLKQLISTGGLHLSLSPSNKCGHVLYRFTTFTVRPRFVRNSNRLPPYSDRFTLHPLWKNQAQNTTSALRRSHTMRSTSIHPSIHSSTQTLISNFPVLQKKNKT